MYSSSLNDKQWLCNRLKQLREHAGLRQIDLAGKLGKPQSYISKYESGEKNLDIFEAKRICDALGVMLSDILHEIEGE